MDLVVEVGEIGTLNESIRAIRIGGTIAFIGVLAGPSPAELRLPLMVMQQQRLQGVTVGSVEDLQAMCDAIAVNKMKPVIDKTFPFDQAAEAFRYMATRSDDGENWTLSEYPVSTDEATATIKLEKSRNIVGWRRK